MKVVKNTAPAAFQPVNVTITFESQQEINDYLAAIGPTSPNARTGALMGCGTKASAAYRRIGCELAAELLGEIFFSVNED